MPGNLNLLTQDKVRLSLPHLTMVDGVSQTDTGIAPLPFNGGQPLTPALFPFGCLAPDAIGEARPWCCRRPSLHRLCGLERPLRVKFAPGMRCTSDLRGIIGNPVSHTCLRITHDPAIRGPEPDRAAATDDLG